MSIHTAGELAYLDTFAGLVPCKVTAVRVSSDEGYERVRVSVKLTATRGAYRRGELIDNQDGAYVVPRCKVRVRDHKYRIRTDYAWMENDR